MAIAILLYDKRYAGTHSGLRYRTLCEIIHRENTLYPHSGLRRYSYTIRDTLGLIVGYRYNTLCEIIHREYAIPHTVATAILLYDKKYAGPHSGFP